jgi:hypothetical protein
MSSLCGYTQEELDYALGQAHFRQAWAYFYLVRVYGPLPKVLTADMDYTLPLVSVAEIFDLIVSDLKAAEQKLPANYTTVPKSMNGVNVVASKGVAQSVLSYVYLTIAGWYWGAIAPRGNDMQRMDRIKDHFNTRKANPEYVFTDPDTGEEIRVQELVGGIEGEWSQAKMYVPYPSQDVRRNPALDISVEEKLNRIN